MDEKKYYILTLSHGWSKKRNVFFKTEDEAKEYAKLLIKQNATYSNNSSISIMSFDELKDLMTISEFEEFFDIDINDPSEIYDYSDKDD